MRSNQRRRVLNRAKELELKVKMSSFHHASRTQPKLKNLKNPSKTAKKFQETQKTQEKKGRKKKRVGKSTKEMKLSGFMKEEKEGYKE